MLIRLATAEDANSILSVYAPYCDTPITFEDRPPTQEEFSARVAGIRERYPYLVVESEGQVIGFAYARPQAERAGYRWNAELSVYLAQGRQRGGLGSILYQAILECLDLMGICAAYARVSMPNPASESLHARLGFTLGWVQKNAGWKCGAWRDAGWFVKPLSNWPGEEKESDEPLPPHPFPSVLEEQPEAVQAILARANEKAAALTAK